MLVSAVHPVMVLSAVFWTVWSFCRFVFDIMGDQMVLAYSMTGRTMVSYVASSVSFCLPQEVEVRALIILVELVAFSLVILMCSLKLSLGSRVRPRIFGFLTVGMVVLLIERFRVMSYSAGSGVKRVEEDFSGFSMRLFSLVHWKMSFRYGCSDFCAMR